MAGVTWGRHTVTGLGNQGGSQNNPSGWDTVDLDTYYSGVSNAEAAILCIHVNATGADRAVGLRKNGSTDVFYRDHRRDSLTHAVVGVDANNQFQVAVETAADVDVVLLGWIADDICYMNTNAESFSVSSTGTYETKTVTSQAGHTAKIALYRSDGTGQTNWEEHTRHADETSWNRPETVYRGGFGAVSLNASEQFEVQMNNTSPNIRVMGYLFTNDVTSVQSPTDRSGDITTDGAYSTITTPTADWVLYRPSNVSGFSTPRAWALRDTGETADDYFDKNRELSFAFVQKATAIEGKVEQNANQEIWEIGYGSNPSSGADITASGTPSIAIPTASGTAEVIKTSSGTPTIPLLTASGAAEIIKPASGTPSIPLITAAGAAEIIKPASGTPSIPLITAAGSATVTSGVADVTASGATSIPLITAAGTATVGRKSSGTPSIPLITAVGTAEIIRTATGTPTIPLITAAGVADLPGKIFASGIPEIPLIVAAGNAAITQNYQPADPERTAIVRAIDTTAYVRPIDRVAVVPAIHRSTAIKQGDSLAHVDQNLPRSPR